MKQASMATLRDANWSVPDGPLLDAMLLGRSLPQILAAVASRQPDHLAVIAGKERISYRALVGRAGAVARFIRDAQAPPGPVALLLPLGVDHLAALVACTAAGRALLPLARANPVARNAAFLAAGGVALVLRDADPAIAEAACGYRSLLLPADLPPANLPEDGLGLDDPAFLLSTSGSTGAPKLVVHSQRNMVMRAAASIATHHLHPGDRIMFIGGHTSYGAIREHIAGLCAGVTICAHDIGAEGISGMFAVMRAERATTLRCFTSLFRIIARLPGAAEACANLRLLRLGAEPVLQADIALAAALVPPECVILNSYGSTETLSFSWQAPRDGQSKDGPVPAGRIEPGGAFLVMGEDGQQCPPGELGELVTSSRYNPLGDWQDGACVLDRFPPDPRDIDSRLYFTGDLARLASDGDLVILGRKDRLVKVNGQRVALIEIETALHLIPECANAVVLPSQDAQGAHLTAFVVAANGAGLSLPVHLRACLASQLPAHMVPRRILVVPELPTLPNGKVDGLALIASLNVKSSTVGHDA